MTSNYAVGRTLLLSGELGRLFIEVLGWDRAHGQLVVNAAGRDWSLRAIAQKRGLAVYVCEPDLDGEIPNSAIRFAIERRVAASIFEHIVVFVDTARTTQVWLWVRREPGRPLARREHRLNSGQSGEALLQKLQLVAFSLDEEAEVTLTGATARTRLAFDVDRVTRSFYDRFKAEHTAFLGFISGIGNVADRAWYGSLMLNRLMFAYFIQKKGLLDSNANYLRDRLISVRRSHGPGHFLSFYRYFLQRLFHEGLGREHRDAQLEALLGKVPYLNGGLFDVHDLERRYDQLDIADEAFEKVFDFFDSYEWHLDMRPLRTDNEINPDVLGYIFEKYINQKQMGAYYTKEDITGYITRYSVLPALLDHVEAACAIAFRPNALAWELLRYQPERYIFPAMKRGLEEPPASSTAGAPPDIADQAAREAPGPARRDRSEDLHEWLRRREAYMEVERQLKSDNTHSIEQLIRLNVDIHQWCLDLIDNAEGPEVVRAFYQALTRLSVLDPACGSGAFLFSALNILEPLYEACLEKMESLLAEAEGEHEPDPYADFRQLLMDVSGHPNRRYFILKTIIVRNLFGVDIMDEAGEICKLRLFLKLIAQVQHEPNRPNFGLEALPDIDFNIRPGNSLVGFVSVANAVDSFRAGGQGNLQLAGDNARLSSEAEAVDEAYRRFQELQIAGNADSERLHTAKEKLEAALTSLTDQLDQYLALQYDSRLQPNTKMFLDWRTRHRPFHWFAEFFGIMSQGGFDAVVGNPPYVVYSAAKVEYALEPMGYRSLSCKNLYAFFLERSTHLVKRSGPVSLIVQLTVMSSERQRAIQDLLLERGELIALPFPRRPQSIFEGVEMPVAIVISRPSATAKLVTTRVQRFYAEERQTVLQRLRLTTHEVRLNGYRIAKLGDPMDVEMLSKILNQKGRVGALARSNGKHVVFYQEACRYWVKAGLGLPHFRRNGSLIAPPHGRTITFDSEDAAAFTCAILNSSLFYWYYSALSDCEHINDELIREFPTPPDWQKWGWQALVLDLMTDLRRNASRKKIHTAQGHIIEYDEMKAARSKPLIDKIDVALGEAFGLTVEEVDAIVSYDLKYRVSQSDDEGDLQGG